jgi:hypothetical protein
MASKAHSNNDETRFWLKFQVCADGLSPRPTASADSDLVGGATTFPRFGDLPPEIRLQIWSHLIQPRVVIAACLDAENATSKTAQLEQRRRLPAVPALLHACAEARELGLRHYERAFAWRVPHMLVDSGAPRPARREACVWFNFAVDALLLLGELEPFDRYGFNSPMVYFLDKEDTARVRHVALAFEELRYGEQDSEQIFGCLFHVLDRFPAAGRLLVTSTPQDLEERRDVLAADDNPIQKVWRGWINGTSVVTSSLADTQILMIRELDLETFIREDR